MKRKLSISTKFIFLTSSLIIFTSLIIILFAVISENSHSYQELLTQGKSFAYIMARNSEHGVYVKDKEELQQIVTILDDNSDIVYAAILDLEKNILAYRGKNYSLQNLAKFNKDLLDKPGLYNNKEIINQHAGRKYINITTPVFINTNIDLKDVLLNEAGSTKQNVIGYVQVGLSKEGIKEKINEFFFVTLSATIFITLTGVFLTVILMKRITSPVKQLHEATKIISAGNFGQCIDIKSNDEISDFACSFNKMSSQLKVFSDEAKYHANEIAEINKNLKQEITVRKKAEISLITTKARLQHLLTATPAVIYSCKPYGDYPVTFVSENVEKLVAYKPSDFLEKQKFWIENIHKDDVSRILNEIIHVYESGHIILEYRFKHRNGTYVWLLAELNLVRDEEGNPHEIVGYWIDITNRKKLEKQLEHDALHDSLTDLPNRALFLDRLEVHIARSNRYDDYLYAVLFLDIDRFKNVNDSLGHMVGDNLLKSVADRLKSCVHRDDTVARLGGDEFAIILDNISSVKYVDKIADRIHSRMKVPFRAEGQEIYLGTSIGIAVGNRNYEMPEQLLRDADTAMYHAKALGGMRHEVFDLSMHEKVVSVLQIENDLRKAIKRNEFAIHYQPIVATNTGEMNGFEALLRWRHSIHGLIPPQAFIPVAEETGLIIPIGQWVLEEACSQMRLWQKLFPKKPPLKISINVSGKQISSSLIEQVKCILNRTGLQEGSLILELTESTIMDKAESVAITLRKLKEMNVKVHIDDFGTGYSSLSSLHNFSIDALKLDSSFIKTIGTEKENLGIIRIISDLSHSLNIDVIAEGVETPKQFAQVKAMKYQYAQGFLFSKPLNKEEAGKFLSQSLILA